MENPITIALFPRGGKNWIAGIIYQQNLMRALQLLPRAERPRLLLLTGVRDRVGDFLESGTDRVASCHYAWMADATRRMKLGGIWRSLARGRWPLSLDKALERAGVDVVFPLEFPMEAGTRTATIGWIPDFQHKRLPEFFSDVEQASRDHAYRRLIGQADHVVVSSEDAKRDIMRWFSPDSSRVSPFPFACVLPPSFFEPDPAAVAARYHLPDKFLMFPSQYWKHKNHGVLFKAILILRDRGLRDISLVCTGFGQDYRFPEYHDQLQQIIADAGLQAHIFQLGLIPRSDQVQLMRRAVALVQPSLFEGWSALIEDCRTLGKRIVASDLPIHREQDLPSARTFDPDRPDRLADLLEEEWATGRPGPDLEAEAAAREAAVENARAFARRFIGIARRAISFRNPEWERSRPSG